MVCVASEHRFLDVTVDQLKQELSLLSLAGYGGSKIDFKAGSSGGFSTTMTMRLFKAIRGEGEGA